jgi:Haem-binding domain
VAEAFEVLPAQYSSSMKKTLKILVAVAFVAFIAIQFFRIDKTNPPINETETLEAKTLVPENLQLIFKRSCNDCHSNNSVYPWYSNVAPMSWSVAEHIKDGRKQLNFSIWETYDLKKKSRKLNEICDEVESGSMPMYQYLWIHLDAKLTEEDKKLICDWTKSVTENLAE